MKLLLLDLDGTIRCSTTGNFIESPEGQKPMLGASEAIKHYADRGWKIAGISNQGGIAAGHKNLESTIDEMWVTLGLFPEIKYIFFCPDFEGKRCIFLNAKNPEIVKYSLEEDEGYKQLIPTPGLSFRKPGVGMLILAIEKLSNENHATFRDATDWHPDYDCWFVGDREEDKGAAEALGINYLNAETWRRRFLPGMHEFRLTPNQVRFLEYQ